MGNNKEKQFYTENYKKLFEFLQNNLDKLDEKTKKTIQSYLDAYTNTFKGDKSTIDFLLKNNQELYNLFIQIDSSLKTIFDEVKNINAQTEALLTTNGKTKEELDKAIIAYKEINKLKEDENVINNEINLTKQEISDKEDLLNKNSLLYSASYKKILQDEIDSLKRKSKQLDNEKNKIETNIKLNENRKKGFNDSDIEEQIQNQEKLNKLYEEANKLQGESAKLGEEISELTAEHTKNVSTFVNVAKAAGNAIVAVAKAGFEKWKEIDEKVYSTGRQIGLSSNQLRGYQENVLKNYDGLASRLGMTFEELFKFQEQYTKNTGRAIILSNEQVETLGTMSKLVGEVATNEMVKNMDDFGASTQTATDYLTLNMARARSQGLDAQKASEAFSNNVKLASKYTFREGVNGISKMTLLSQKLKFNMDSIANAAEKFETVEGAIGTAANLQMLGGTYSAQFGNPLEAMNMAMLDMEGFTQKVVDTFSNKATFNRETGQVEMSAIDKRLMREAAKQMGISYDEAWNMASQQAKIGDVERQINKTQNFSEEDKSWITSNSQYNAETKQHQITFFENGEQKTVDVRDLTSEQLKQVKAQAISEKAIQGDVQGIHSILKAYAQKEMGDSKSWNEMMKGWKESAEINVANVEDTLLSPIKNHPLKFLTEENWWMAYLGLNMGSQVLGGLLTQTIGGYLEHGFSGLGGKLSPSMTKMKKGFKGAAKSVGGWAKKSGGAIGRGIVNYGGKALGGIKGVVKMIPGWGKAIGIGATLIGGGMALMSNTDGKEVDKTKLGGREVEPNDDNTKPINNTEKPQELTELEKQTLLLQTIAEKQGVDTSRILDLSTTNTNTVNEAGMSESMLSFMAANFGDKIYKNQMSKMLPKSIGSVNSTISEKISTKLTTVSNKITDKGADIMLDANKKKGASKLIQKTIGKGIAKTGGKLAMNAATKGLAGPAGWIGMAVDGVNFGGQALGLWEEGSHTDKLMQIGSKTASYAGIGAMIAGPVGAAVGGAVGLVSGTIQQYGKEIKEFGSKVYNGVKEGLFGSDNMTEADKMQQSYEESKLGIVDITDPQLEQKAYMATCKIHDVVISMWHHMNGKQSNGLEKDKGLFGGIGSLFGFDKITVKDNNSITPKVSVGLPTSIRETSINSQYNNSLSNNLDNNKIDLNISGTIKLTSDKGSNVDIDINKLLSNDIFKSKLGALIAEKLTERNSRYNKNSRTFVSNTLDESVTDKSNR